MRVSIIKNIAGRTGILLVAIAMLAAVAACSDDESDAPAVEPAAQETPAAAQAQAQAEPAESAEPLRVVTTTSIVADWVANIGGDHVDVFSIVPVGADPHAFQPGAQDVAKIADADLVLSIGLGLEESWLLELLENAAQDPDAIVELGEVIEPIEFAASHAEEVEMIEGISHVVHEVEEGEIDAATGLEEITELLDAAEAAEAAEEGEDHEEDEDHAEEEEAEEEGDDHAEEEDDHAGEEELHEMVREIIAEVDAGTMDAEEAIEEIEHLAEEGEEGHEGHGHGIHDPHFWFDPIRVQVVVSDIADRLSALDPDRADAYRANADAYNAQLDELHAWTEEQIGGIPADRRLLVTSHDSLGYFADRYGFEVIGTVIPGGSTDVEPSAEDLIELTEEIAKYDVPAVFGETTVSERLAASIAAESGAALVQLYSGSLGTDGSGAETFIGMVRTNVERIADALG
jgi:ABC-type Zn uptake system ZnuABC Zn-binding protein ZnuA